MRKIQLWAAVTLIGTFCAAPYTAAEVPARTPALFSQKKNSTAQRIIDELNRVRSNPAAYADTIEKNRNSIPTQEGPSVIDETIQVLRSTPTLPPLTLSRGMSLAARDHVQDTGSLGTVGHDGSDGSQPWDRIARYGSASGEQRENVSYGASSPREVVVQLLVDDGVPSRGHRESILSPKYRVAGVACGSHAQYRVMCVIDYAQGFTERSSAANRQPISMPSEQQTEQVVSNTTVPEQNQQPARSTSDNQAKSVVVYGTKECDNTTYMRQQLANNGIAFEFRDVSSPESESNKEMWNALRRVGVSNTNFNFPVLQVKGKVMIQPTIEDVKRELDT